MHAPDQSPDDLPSPSLNDTAKSTRRQFWRESLIALAALQMTSLGAQMPGGRPPGGAGGPAGGSPKDRPAETLRCPPVSAGPMPLTEEVIINHYAMLKSDLKLAGTTVALFDGFVGLTKSFLLDDERKKFGPRTVSASGASRLAQQLDEARNRYTALEDIDEQAKRLMVTLNDGQRTQFASRLLPMPPSSTR